MTFRILSSKADKVSFAVVNAKTHVVENVVLADQKWIDDHPKHRMDGAVRHDLYFVELGHWPQVGWTYDQASGKFTAPVEDET